MKYKTKIPINELRVGMRVKFPIAGCWLENDKKYVWFKAIISRIGTIEGEGEVRAVIMTRVYNKKYKTIGNMMSTGSQCYEIYKVGRLMYDILRSKSIEFSDCYIYKSKNNCGQIINFEIYRVIGGYLYATLYITSKRKSGFQKGSITGKDGVKSFIWAKRCLVDFMKFAKYKYSGMQLRIKPDSNRLRKIYEHALLPLGFKVMKSVERELYINL